MIRKNWTPHQHKVYKQARKVYLDAILTIENTCGRDNVVVEAQNFYFDASVWCTDLAERTGYPFETVARVLAVTSPLKSWDQNKEVTRKYFEDGVPVSKLPLTSNRKIAVVRAVCGEISDGSIKVKSFYDNIVNDHCSKEVTIDRHMARPVLGKVTVTSREYEALAEAVHSIARSRRHPRARGNYAFCSGPSCTQALLWWWFREGRKKYVKDLDTAAQDV